MLSTHQWAFFPNLNDYSIDQQYVLKRVGYSKDDLSWSISFWASPQ